MGHCSISFPRAEMERCRTAAQRRSRGWDDTDSRSAESPAKVEYRMLRMLRIRWNTMEYDGIRWNTMEYDGIRWNTMEYDGIRWNTMEYDGTRWNTMEYNEIFTVEFVDNINININSKSKHCSRKSTHCSRN
jgi:hypothetical protein